jgi:hypothetical protein
MIGKDCVGAEFCYDLIKSVWCDTKYLTKLIRMVDFCDCKDMGKLSRWLQQADISLCIITMSKYVLHSAPNTPCNMCLRVWSIIFISTSFLFRVKT